MMRIVKMSVSCATIVAGMWVMGCGESSKGGSPSSTPNTTGATNATGATGGENKGACDRREKDHVCGEYRGKMATEKWIRGECEAMKAPFVAECPKEKSVGTCIRDKGTPSETRTTFYEPMTKETVETMCKGGELAL